jgi:hypothetical protein
LKIETFFNIAEMCCIGEGFGGEPSPIKKLCLIVKRPCKPTDIDKNSQPHKTAHLILPETRANASQNQKSHFFANAPTRILTLKRIK